MLDANIVKNYLVKNATNSDDLAKRPRCNWNLSSFFHKDVATTRERFMYYKPVNAIETVEKLSKLVFVCQFYSERMEWR